MFWDLKGDLKQSLTLRATARSSASAKMMLAPFPPNSSVTRFKVSEAAREIALPARVEPVNEIISMSGWTDLKTWCLMRRSGYNVGGWVQAVADTVAVAVDEVENSSGHTWRRNGRSAQRGHLRAQKAVRRV